MTAEIRVNNQSIIRLAKSYLKFANTNEFHEFGFCSWAKRQKNFYLHINGEIFNAYRLFEALVGHDVVRRNQYLSKNEGVTTERIEYAKRLIETFENEGVRVVFDKNLRRWQIKAVTDYPDAKNRRDRLVRWVKATVDKNLKTS